MQAAEDIGFRLPLIHCYCLRYQEGGIQMLSYGTIEPHTLELLRQLSGHPLNSEMRLVGGTALALQYGHRKSVDLDFFEIGRASCRERV